ncbi:MAG: Fic family protein, partial [archaeon]|nr:Fic family protein [archaeon]
MKNINDYEELKGIYYSDKTPDKEEYNKEYNQRINSTFSIIYDIAINDNPLFLCITPEIYNLTTSFLNKKEELNNLIKNTRSEIITNYSYLTLLNEIENTNKIEGVTSTKKAISNTLDIINSNRKVEIKNSEENRLYGMVKKYLMLTNNSSCDKNDESKNDNKNILKLNTSNDIRKLYDEILFEEIKHNSKDDLPDGKCFRKNPVYILSDIGNKIHEGISGEKNIIKYMDKALEILNDKSYELINICVFHYLFGYIHPFYDGNGRLNRFITSYKLNEYFDNTLVGLKLSQVIYKTRNAYNKSFKITNDVLNKSDATLFVTYMLSTINNDIEELINDLTSSNKKYESYKNK